MTAANDQRVYTDADLLPTALRDVKVGDLLASGRALDLGGYTAQVVKASGWAGPKAEWEHRNAWRLELADGSVRQQPEEDKVLIVAFDAPVWAEPIGPHEQALLEDRARTGVQYSTADRVCARHYDNCPNCQDDAKSSTAREKQAERTENARRVLAVGVLIYRQELEELRKKAERGEPIPADAKLLDALIKGLRKLESAGDRAGAK